VYFDDIDLISNRAVDLINEGRLDEAEKACQRLFREFPDLPDGFVRTAALHEARGQTQEAAECYRKAADLQLENDPEYGHELATHYRMKADELDADAGAREATPPDDPS
jgi:tetratricopeptide (TPR) repeat protein